MVSHTHTHTHNEGKLITTSLCSTLSARHTVKSNRGVIDLMSAPLLMCLCPKNLAVSVIQVHTLLSFGAEAVCSLRKQCVFKQERSVSNHNDIKGKSDILQQNALNGFPAELDEKIKPSCQCSKYKATDRRLLPSNTVTTIIWCFTGSLCQTISLAGNRDFLTFGPSHENRFPLFLVFMLISTEQVPTLATYSMYRHESVVNLPTLL